MKAYTPGDPALEKEPFAFVTARDGHYLLKRNGLFDACVKVEAIPGVPEQKEFFALKVSRIPSDLFLTALAFMKKAYEIYKSEALVLLTFEKGQWGLHVPKQEVGAAGVRYANRDRVRAVGSIHSHPGFSPTPSGIDERDEMAFDGVHVIVSSFHPAPQTMVAFAVVNGRRFAIRPQDLIEGLEGPDVPVPDEWLARVSGVPTARSFQEASPSHVATQEGRSWQGGLWEREDALAEDGQFYKTVFRVTLLSQSPVSEPNLHELIQDIAGEECSADVAVLEQRTIAPEECARLALRQGSDPSLFGLDDDGNAIE